MNDDATAVQRIASRAEVLHSEALQGDLQNNLSRDSISALKASGGFRLLLAREFGGDEAHPNEFIDWVIEAGSHQASAGWVAGVVGVHPWEIAFMDPRLQEEVYGSDPDTLTASPYAPFGNARPVDGGFLLSGEWPYSTGTEHCQWVILGGNVTDANGNPPEGPPDVRHFMLPRGDYDIVPDSWNVMGLRGTGSFNVRMRDAFVPSYRVCEATQVIDGSLAEARRPDSPLYQMMFGVMFPAAIAAGTLGIAQGLLRKQRHYVEGRLSTSGTIARQDPVYLHRLAAAEADLDASVCHLRTMLDALYRQVVSGRRISIDQRLRFRRNQVRATDRVFESITPLARLAGSAGVQEKNELERWWRDLQTAITHMCNDRDGAYTPWACHTYGSDIPPAAFF